MKSRWKRPEYRSNGDPLLDRGYVDFLNGTKLEQNPEDACGHGTHMAGIILQLAPHAELFIARVFENNTLSLDANVTSSVGKVVNKISRSLKIALTLDRRFGTRRTFGMSMLFPCPLALRDTPLRSTKL